MRLFVLFIIGIVAGLVCIPLAATLRERVAAAWREFRAGWYGRGGYETGTGGGGAPAVDGRVNSDDSEKVWIIPGPSELHVQIRPLE